MIERMRAKLSYANVISTLGLFLVLSGGTAIALNGHNTVFSDDIAPGEVRLSDLAVSTRPHALLLDQFGDDTYSDRHVIGGIGKIQLTGLCVADNETGFGLPGFDLFVQSHRVVQIGYALQQNTGAPIVGETAVGTHGGEARIFHIEGGPGGLALADGQIVVRDGSRVVTFVLHAAADPAPVHCRVAGIATRAAP